MNRWLSDFRPEVEIWPYCACAMRNMQYNPYLMTKSWKFLQEQFGHWSRYHIPQNVFLVCMYNFHIGKSQVIAPVCDTY